MPISRLFCPHYWTRRTGFNGQGQLAPAWRPGGALLTCGRSGGGAFATRLLPSTSNLRRRQGSSRVRAFSLGALTAGNVLATENAPSYESQPNSRSSAHRRDSRGDRLAAWTTTLHLHRRQPAFRVAIAGKSETYRATLRHAAAGATRRRRLRYLAGRANETARVCAGWMVAKR